MNVQITGRTGGRPASFADYQELFAPCNRPQKFSPEEVGFVRVDPPGITICGSCAHYWRNPYDGAVCEIMRFADERRIPEYAACRFYTNDGSSFPLLNIL